MHTKIIERLESFEQEYNVKVLYAVESGSRAWGFASTTSDYDVRFIYAETIDRYLSLENTRDVIESTEENGLLDFSGWDLKKAMKLFRKGNPALMEWLNSPIVYIDRYGVADILRSAALMCFSPKSSIYHYLHMSNRNYNEYITGDRVRVKRYFYVLRPIFACHWILKYQNQPPVLYSELFSDIDLPANLEEEIENLYSLRVSLQEDEHINKSEIVNKYIIEEFSSLKKLVDTLSSTTESSDNFDNVFRQVLKDVWGF